MVSSAAPAGRRRALATGADGVVVLPASQASLAEVLTEFCFRAPSLDPTRVDALRSVGGGLPSLFRDLRDAFADQAERALESLWDPPDAATASEHLHALKGASRQVGATRLAAALERVEKEPAQLEPSYGFLRFEAKRVLEELAVLADLTPAAARPS